MYYNPVLLQLDKIKYVQAKYKVFGGCVWGTFLVPQNIEIQQTRGIEPMVI